MRHYLLIADRLGGGEPLWVALHQPPHLGDETFGEHLLDPRLDAGLQGLHARDEHQLVEGEGRLGAGEGTRRSAGASYDLQRPDHPPRVVLRSLCVRRTRGAQFALERLQPSLLELPPQPCLDHLIHRRHRRQALREPPEVEAGAPQHERHPPPGQHPSDGLLGESNKVRHIESLGGIYDVDQVMRHSPPLFSGGLGSSHIHASVDLHGVG